MTEQDLNREWEAFERSCRKCNACDLRKNAKNVVIYRGSRRAPLMIVGEGEEVDPEIHRFVKAADKLSAHIKCLEELKASNHEFILAARQTRQALDDMDMPEVRYFIEHFLDSFTLTLDELK